MTVTQSTARERYAPKGWDLSQLLEETGESHLREVLDRIERDVKALEARRGSLENAGPADLVGIVDLYESIIEQMTVLGAYAGLWFSADTQDEAALTFRNRIQHQLTLLQNRILFFPLWWKRLPEERALGLIPDPASRPDIAFYLGEQRRLREFALDEAREQLINTKDADGIGGLLTIYSMLSNRLVFELEVDGERKKLTRDQLMTYALSPDPSLRERAYQELGSVLKTEAKILAQIYSHRVRDWYSENVLLRGYATPLTVRNLANDVPDNAVDALLDTVERNAPLFHRYFDLKASWLGRERLRRYDIYAPVAERDQRVDFPEAAQSVLTTFEAFHPRFAREARRVFDEEHIDSEIRPGKRSGAFCAAVLPRLTPWVLVNFAGRLRDVATLAHELGHAVHAMLAADHSVLTYHPSLPMAETASVFAEMLMTDRLLQTVTDTEARKELLAGAVDDIYATVLRQAFFVRFEVCAHDAILENRSTEELCDLYMENLQRQFGENVEIAPEFRYEWLGIPHIFSTPFYCYAYSFGQLLVLALYRRYQEDPEAFKPGYLRILACGGAARPAAMLEEVGIDIEDAAFWQGGFDVVAELIDQLEAL